jgi:hypothetical protein
MSLVDTLDSILGRHVGTSGDEHVYLCCFCLQRKGTPDEQGHLYINTTKPYEDQIGVFHCFRCGSSGPVSAITGSTEPALPGMAQFRQELARRLGLSREAPKEPDLPDYPLDYSPLIVVDGADRCQATNLAAYRYCQSRLIGLEDIAYYKIGVGTLGRTEIPPDQSYLYAGNGRLVFPDYDEEGNIQYWCARTFVGHRNKYKNCRVPSKDKIYNYWRMMNANDHSRLIITEGVISAIAAGHDAVATYGKLITRSKLQLLLASDFREYIVALDGDTHRRVVRKRERYSVESETYQLAQALHVGGKYVRVVQFRQDEDPASVDDIKARIETAEKFGPRTLRILFE